MRIPDIAALRRMIPGGFAAHAAGAVFLFLFWRIAGMPDPGLAGRLIPLAWLLAGFVSPHAGPGRAGAAALVVSAAAGFFWATSDLAAAVSMASMTAGLFPAMIRSFRRGGRHAASAVLPLAPLILLSVPFTGDEPLNAALCESIFLDGDTDVSDNLRQIDRWASVSPEAGAPVAGISHQQPLFSLLLVPGLWFGIPGYRILPLIVSILAAWLAGRCAGAAGSKDGAMAGAAALLFLPGAACAGLAYADWAAAGIVAAGALGIGGRRPLLAALAAALALAALKLRFAPLGAGLVIAALAGRRGMGPARTAIAVIALTAVALAADRYLLGGRVFWVRYGNVEFLSTLWNRTVSSGSDLLRLPVFAMVDQEAGLLWRAPWLTAAVPGTVALARAKTPAGRALLLSGALYLAGLVVWTPMEWHSMPTPAGRFFIALMPLAASAASFRGIPRPLLALSILASAMYIAVPGLRFNHLDGCDAFFDILGRGLPGNLCLALPSMVRPAATVTAAWFAFWVLLSILLLARRNGAALVLAALAVPAAAALAASTRGVYEAEDLSPDYRIGCSLYPLSQDPPERMAWPGSSERLLRLGEAGDAVVLPVEPGDGGSVRVELVLRGFTSGAEPPVLAARFGDWSRLSGVASPQQPLPDWIGRVREGEAPPPSPGNARDTLIVLEVPCAGAGVLILSPQGSYPPGEGIFLDRVRITGT